MRNCFRIDLYIVRYSHAYLYSNQSQADKCMCFEKDNRSGTFSPVELH